MQQVMVAVPALNEASTVADVVGQAAAALPGAHIVVVDDGSTDDTAAAAAAAGAVVLRLPFNVGVGGALRTAFLYAKAHDFDAVLQVDADGQHDPVQATRLLGALDGASVVVGSRFLEADSYPVPAMRRFTMRVVGWLVSRVTGTALTDTTSGFRAADRRAIALFAEHYPAEYLGDTIESLVLAHRAGLPIAEVPVSMRSRQGGSPSHNPFRSVLYLSRALLALVAATGRPVSRGSA
jgi:glycosyltransferase involved in cell wall biosynthesis